ncbi:MAG: hypothetical protein FJW30_14085 [Acidobacteria bacterium]|nr:hypothetical protein [Acidobacteriota bacterium]
MTLHLLRLACLTCTLAVYAQTGTITSVLELQGRSTTVAPGDPIIVRGTNLVRATPGVSQPPVIAVTAGGRNTSIRSFSATVIEAVPPYDLAPGTHPLVITQDGTTNATRTVTVARVAPNLLTSDWSREGSGMITRIYRTRTVLENGVSILEYPPVSASNPLVPGEALFVMATGLGVSNPATPSLTFPAVPVPVAAKVELTVNGRQMENVRAVIDPEEGIPFYRQVNRFNSILGWTRIYFNVPKDMAAGAYTLRVSADGTAGNSVQFVVGTRQPVISTVSTATNKYFGLAPGALQSIFGVNFGGATATGGFTSLKAGDVSVELDGRAVPVLGVYEPQGQVNFVSPMDLPVRRRVVLTLKTPDGTINYPMFTVESLPSLFKLTDPTDTKRSFAIATLPNSAWLPLPGAVAAALRFPVDCAANEISPLSSCAAPAKPGDILQFYVTGLGLATPDGTEAGPRLGNGAVAPADGSVLYKVVAPVTVTVGGVGAEVVFAGVTPGYAGLYQLNVRVPAAVRPSDAVNVEISMRFGTQNITDSALIAVSAP